MSSIYRVRKYLKYLISAKTRLYIHSPFVFDYVNNVKNNINHYYAFDAIEDLRRALLKDTRQIQVEDFGAGSDKFKDNQRHISQITRFSASRSKKAQHLFRLINHYQPNNILELGTSMGIGTSYLASAKKDIQVYTIEGASEVAEIAKGNFKTLGLNNIKSFTGPFDTQLPEVLKVMEKVDVAFIDGHHMKEPTLKYFKQILPYLHEESILIFDDIYWSKGMTEAWEEIKAHPQIIVTVDLFEIGICFFHSTQAKQNFMLHF